MTITRGDFEAIAGVIKAQHDTIAEEYRLMRQGSDDQIKSYAHTRYDAACVALADVAQGLTNVFRQSNPLFREWLFYSACGLSKFYTQGRADRCGKDWEEIEGVNMAYLYLANATFSERA